MIRKKLKKTIKQKVKKSDQVSIALLYGKNRVDFGYRVGHNANLINWCMFLVFLQLVIFNFNRNQKLFDSKSLFYIGIFDLINI